jgi:Zn-dependent M16 (insulinase) family peptidase
VRFISDFNLKVFELVHIKSQSTYIHVDANDYNNTFAIIIPTIPQNDKGIPYLTQKLIT